MRRVEAAAVAAVVIALHVIGFALLFSFGVLGVGVGITAYTLGLRHAFDADHLGAIDNTTRKLMSEGQRPLSVGLFFSLGHSTVVFGLVVAIGGVAADQGSWLHSAASVVGPLI